MKFVEIFNVFYVLRNPTIIHEILKNCELYDIYLKVTKLKNKIMYNLLKLINYYQSIKFILNTPQVINMRLTISIDIGI